MLPIVIRQTTGDLDCFIFIAGPLTIVSAWQGLQPVAANAVPTAWLLGGE